MHPIANTSPVGRPAAPEKQPADAPSVVPAKFLDMYRGAIAAAVDADGDGQVSEAEYARQLMHAGGSAQAAQDGWKSFDTDGDGRVSTEEFAKSVADPFGNERDALLRRILDELRTGQGAVQPKGYVLDASGKVADPHAALRYLAANFSGNMQY
jgi:hypothetical protein